MVQIQQARKVKEIEDANRVEQEEARALAQ